jgi:hypothetical protein
VPAEKTPSVGWIDGNGVKTSFEVRSVHELLDVIRKVPGLFTGKPSVTALSHFLHGFQLGLRSVERSLGGGDPPFDEFHDWVAMRFGVYEPTSGWANMLLESMGDESSAFERFFIELDEFRRRTTYDPIGLIEAWHRRAWMRGRLVARDGDRYLVRFASESTKQSREAESWFSASRLRRPQDV